VHYQRSVSGSPPDYVQYSGSPQVPQLLRTVPYDGDYFRRFYSSEAFTRPQQYVTQRATEICEQYEDCYVEGDEMSNTIPYQLSPEQHLVTNGDGEAVQYAVSDHVTQPPVVIQKELAEFPLDEVSWEFKNC